MWAKGKKARDKRKKREEMAGLPRDIWRRARVTSDNPRKLTPRHTHLRLRLYVMDEKTFLLAVIWRFQSHVFSISFAGIKWISCLQSQLGIIKIDHGERQSLSLQVNITSCQFRGKGRSPCIYRRHWCQCSVASAPKARASASATNTRWNEDL